MDLRAALAGTLADVRSREIAPAVHRLIDGYRAARTPDLDSPEAVTAYAVYRMPATYAALCEVFAQLGPLEVRTMLDVGGGTGAAAWATAEALPGISSITVADRSDQALALGRRLAATSTVPALRSARWQRLTLDARTELPRADLLVAAYLLGELDPVTRHGLVEAMATSGATVVLVEPGTPEGYRRILAAREQLLTRGHGVIAPCPHGAPCPLTPTNDWCHFAVRLERSALHRRVKGAELGYEDEKFAYVATAPAARPRAAGRVLRHPVTRKGLVGLTVCQDDGQVARAAVGRSASAYRAARATRWGDPWPRDAD